MCSAYSTQVSLSPRGTSGGRVGEEGGRATPGELASSPRPSPPAGKEREKRQQCNAKHRRDLAFRAAFFLIIKPHQPQAHNHFPNSRSSISLATGRDGRALTNRSSKTRASAGFVGTHT